MHVCTHTSCAYGMHFGSLLLVPPSGGAQTFGLDKACAPSGTSRSEPHDVGRMRCESHAISKVSNSGMLSVAAFLELQRCCGSTASGGSALLFSSESGHCLGFCGVAGAQAVTDRLNWCINWHTTMIVTTQATQGAAIWVCVMNAEV